MVTGNRDLSAADSPGSPEHWMRQALALADRGLYSTQPNPRVGCVIVKDSKAIGRGWHKIAGGPHAEIMALQGLKGGLSEADIYITMEPCSFHGRTPPCAAELIKHKPRKVYLAMQDPHPQVKGEGIRQLQEAGVPVECGILEQEARKLNRGYVRRHEAKRPWVSVKLAQSSDGKVAFASPPANAKDKWITGEEARADVHRLRAASCAVLSGASSVRQDNSKLNARLAAEKTADSMEEVLQPLRIVLDPQFQLDPKLDFFTTAGPKLWVGADNSKPASPLPAETEAITLPLAPGGGLDLHELLKHLAAREVNELFVESGPRLTTAFLEAKLVEELIVYVSPCIMGTEALSFDYMKADKNSQFKVRERKPIGEDLRLIMRPE